MENFIAIVSIDEYKGGIPSGYDLVVYEGRFDGDPEDDEIEERVLETSAVLYGFDEIGMFDGDYIQAEYGFLRH